MNEPQGVVERLVFPESGLPFAEYRTFLNSAWGWERNPGAANIFVTFQAAEAHVAELRAQGEAHAHAVVSERHEAVEHKRAEAAVDTFLNRTPIQLRIAHARRRASRVTPGESQAMMARQLGERES